MNEQTELVHSYDDLILDTISPLLIDGERIEAAATQCRIYAILKRRLILVATNMRLLAVQRRLLPGFDMKELRWQDIVSASVVERVFGADLDLIGSTKADLASAEKPDLRLRFPGLEKTQAKAVYRMCQNHAQSWRERRRVRELEEMRARSGGITLPAFANTAASGDVEPRLQQLKDLHDKGLITDSEFDSSKAKILSGL